MWLGGGKGFKGCKCTRVESNFLITENVARGAKVWLGGGKGFKGCKCTRVESNFLITENVARGGKGVRV